MFNKAREFNPDNEEYINRGLNINNLLGYKYLKEKQYDVAAYFYEILIK